MDEVYERRAETRVSGPYYPRAKDVKHGSGNLWVRAIQFDEAHRVTGGIPEQA